MRMIKVLILPDYHIDTADTKHACLKRRKHLRYYCQLV